MEYCIAKEVQELAQFLEQKKVSLGDFAKLCKVGKSTIHNLFKKNIFPVIKWTDIQKGFEANFQDDLVKKNLKEINEKIQNENNENNDKNNKNHEEPTMILRKQNLSQSTRQHFNLVANPFSDPKNGNELYLTGKSRFVRECLLDAAKNGNFLALVGESGAGKSTLRQEFTLNVKNSDLNVIFIEPSVLTMSAQGGGDTLKARHIMQAILQTLKPTLGCGGSSELLARKVQKALVESHQAGFKHVLIIEEAHDLHTQTLKHLKRFWELVDGMERLLSIVLVGQPELGRTLGTASADIREVVQRCDVIELPAIDNVESFLEFKFSKNGYNLSDFFEKEALESMQEKLCIAKTKENKVVFYGYPLAITNLAIACLNLAADLGESIVSAEIVSQIQR